MKTFAAGIILLREIPEEERLFIVLNKELILDDLSILRFIDVAE